MTRYTFRFSLLVLLVILLGTSVVPVSRVDAATATITPSTSDTYLSAVEYEEGGDERDSNFGNVGDMIVDPGTDKSELELEYERRGIVKFDLSSIPAGSIINNVHLQLYVTLIMETDDPTGETLTVYRVTEDWAEMEATWNSRLTGTSWTGTNPVGSGGTWTVTDAASATIPSSGTGYWMDWTVTDIVKEWFENGQPNYGFIIISGSSKAWAIGFFSREGTPTSIRPVLVVDYTPPFDFSVSAGGGLTVTQGGSGSVTITVDLVSGSTKTASLSVSGLPPGASASFNPPSGNPTFTSILTITTSASTPAGSYMITVSATGSQTRETTFTLKVDYDSNPVGGILVTVNKLEILTPYLALAGLIIAVSTVYVIKKRKD